MRGKYNKKND
jgi:chromosome segregation ATPase